MRKLFFTFAALFFLLDVFCQEKPDMDMIARIKKEGTDSSKVMDIAHHLTDVSGPRLTNSPGFVRAANWAKDELTSWGLVNAQLEPWANLGKAGNRKNVTWPWYRPIINH